MRPFPMSLLLPLLLPLLLAPGLPAQPRRGPPPEEILQALDRACGHLLEVQIAYDFRRDPLARSRERGREEAAPMEGGAEWPYEGVYRSAGPEGVRVIPPGYRVGGTAICCLALMESPGFGERRERREAVLRGIDFMLDFMEGNPEMDASFRQGYDVRGWGHAYALAACLRALEEPGLLQEPAGRRVKRTAGWLVDVLEKSEIEGRGGWNYSRQSRRGQPPEASTFMTAPTVLALMQAKGRGFAVQDDVVSRALDTLEAARLDDLATFQYGSGPGKGRARATWEHPAGSSARSAACELALLLGGRGSVGRLRAGIAQFFLYWDELKERHQGTGTHLSGNYMIAPYYFYFGHTYAALAIEFLPAEERPAMRERMAERLWKTRQEDGTWNDRVFPRSSAYGTAMSILALRAPEHASVFRAAPVK